ncbi:m7GpppX diphosphatase isoform X2 [Prorops nasuta]
MAEKVLDIEEKVECPPAKKAKLDESSSENNDSIHEKEVNLSTFEMKRILQNNTYRKQICIEGIFKGHECPAVVVLEKKNFPMEELFLKRGFFNESTILRKLYTNDVYGNYECFPTREYNGLNTIVIHPATPKHIDKFIKKELHIINETYELYEKVVSPYIKSMDTFSLKWIDNILEGKAEQENIIYQDKDKDVGFVLLTDLKWDKTLSTLKLIALPYQNITCIRELNETHLPLLKNIQKAGTEAITEKFGIPASQLRLYLHYQPSYYYLHVHFSYLMFDTPGIFVEKAHLLSSVISNIELIPDYYKKAVLSFVVFKGDLLFKKFQEIGILEKDNEQTETTEAES